jgi:hypothetical protein
MINHREWMKPTGTRKVRIREEQRRTVKYNIVVPNFLIWNRIWREQGTCPTWDLRDIFGKHGGEGKMMSLWPIELKSGSNVLQCSKVFGGREERPWEWAAPLQIFFPLRFFYFHFDFRPPLPTCQISQIVGSTICQVSILGFLRPLASQNCHWIFQVFLRTSLWWELI